jgi:hypothetical protein
MSHRRLGNGLHHRSCTLFAVSPATSARLAFRWAGRFRRKRSTAVWLKRFRSLRESGTDRAAAYGTDPVAGRHDWFGRCPTLGTNETAATRV